MSGTLSRRALALLLLIPFTALSLYALMQAGYAGIWLYQFQSAAGWQVIADLVVACVLIMVWLVPDAKRKGVAVWPFLLLTATLGSFGALFYLVIHGGQERAF